MTVTASAICSVTLFGVSHGSIGEAELMTVAKEGASSGQEYSVRGAGNIRVRHQVIFRP